MFYGPKTPSNYNKISLNVRLPKESLRFAWSEDILVRLIANKLTPVNPFFAIEMVFLLFNVSLFGSAVFTYNFGSLMISHPSSYI